MRRRGFTLLEMVIVVAILVVIAGTIIATMDSTEDTAKQRLAVTEMGTIREACLRWRADMGRWPSRLSFLTYTLAEIQAEFDSNNESSLYANEVPVALRTWDPVTRRGFRGPYLLLPHDATSPASRVVLRTIPSSSTKKASFIVDSFFISSSSVPAGFPLDYQCYRYPAIDHPAADPNGLAAGTLLTITCAGTDAHFDTMSLGAPPENTDYNDPVDAQAKPTQDNVGPVTIGTAP